MAVQIGGVRGVAATASQLAELPFVALPRESVVIATYAAGMSISGGLGGRGPPALCQDCSIYTTTTELAVSWYWYTRCMIASELAVNAAC